jgi:hypothetical protein
MKTVTRRGFTIDEDKLLLENWWDPAQRERLAALLRYYSLLRKMGVDPGIYRSSMRLKELAAGLSLPVSIVYNPLG